MRIAVVGGGASGLAAAWLLDEAHQVTLFEREPMLGGHIRTLGGNVPSAALPAGVRLDTGVIEFDRVSFPAFHAWMKALGVPLPDLERGGSSTLFLPDGRRFHSQGAIGTEDPTLSARLREVAQLVPIALRRRRFLRQAARTPAKQLVDTPIESFLSHDEFSTWLRCMLMYAYSMHYEQVAHISAEMAVPMLQDFLITGHWTHMPQGVSSYVDAAARSLRGPVVLNARIQCVRRGADGVTVVHADGSTQPFDAVVLAVPPHRVLGLLGDPSENESRWFSHFTGGPIHTVLHSDTGLYARRGAHAWSEFDLFELPNGGHGYNAYLNRLCGVPETGPVHYGLAFDLESEIDPSKVIHRQSHDVAAYTEHALATRRELAELNGQGHTWFAGAFLGDGLHEGAVRSALAVAGRLGGRALPGFNPGSGPH